MKSEKSGRQTTKYVAFVAPVESKTEKLRSVQYRELRYWTAKYRKRSTNGLPDLDQRELGRAPLAGAGLWERCRKIEQSYLSKACP